MFGVYIQVHIKCFLTFLEAHSLHIFLEIFYQLWPAQASSEQPAAPEPGCQHHYLLCSIWCDLDLVQIPSHSVRMLHKTIFKMVELLWR